MRDAAGAMEAVNSFSFTADVTSGSNTVHITGRFSTPNNLYEMVVVGVSTVELARIGSQSYRRETPGGAWAAVTAASATPPTDPRIAFSSLTGVSDVTVVGARYSFTLIGSAAGRLISGSSTVTGSAVLTNGLITDLSYQSASPAVTVHLTYSAFNTSPAVTALPA